MDIERVARGELRTLLAESFVCIEEAAILHAVFDHSVRADLIAVPNDPRFRHLTFAFEVKVPNATWEFKNWTSAIKQASDYIWGVVQDKSHSEEFKGRRISAAYVYPGPNLNAVEDDSSSGARFYREYDKEAVAGAFALGVHFRVGSARRLMNTRLGLELKMGTNTIWSSRGGFKAHAENLFLGNQRIGSGKIAMSKLRELR